MSETKNPFASNDNKPTGAPVENHGNTAPGANGSATFTAVPSPQPIVVGDGVAGRGHLTRRRVIVSVAATLLVACLVVAGAVFIGHRQLVVGCQDSLILYRQQSDKLQELLDDNKDTLDITTDEVLSSDKFVVNDFQTSYKQAQELLDSLPNDSQCASSQSNDDLRETTYELADALLGLDDLYSQVEHGGEAVQVASELKELADAKSALRSTLLSAKSLSQNQSLSASVRTQLNRAVVQAADILEGDDLEDIVSAREQMDDIIDEINDSLSAANEELLDIEQKVAAIENRADANGDYTNSATEILHAAGLQEIWGLERMRGACILTDEQASSWLAAFCSGTPNNIYINSHLTADVTGDAYFADAMRHEIAHYLIYRRCGTSDPASIGNQANAESTASSYAVLYLGANANTLNRAADVRYHMDQASDEAAARIHAGQCY